MIEIKGNKNVTIHNSCITSEKEKKVAINGNQNLTIRNSCITGEWNLSKLKKFDHKEKLPFDNVKTITINCDCSDIIVKGTDDGEIDAHFFGEASTIEDPYIDIKKRGAKVFITVKVGNMTTSSGLTLGIKIPNHAFEKLVITSSNGNISIAEEIAAKTMNLHTCNGNIECEGTFSDITGKTTNGTVTIRSYNKNNINLKLLSTNGDINIILANNVKACNVKSETKNGHVRNELKKFSIEGYMASGYARTTNGNITILSN